MAPAGESNRSLFVRAAVVWWLMVATVVATVWACVTDPDWLHSRWVAAPVLSAAMYPCAALAFWVATWPDRLVSALKCSGQAAVLAGLTAWINPTTWSEAPIPIVLLAAGISVALWRAARAEGVLGQ